MDRSASHPATPAATVRSRGAAGLHGRVAVVLACLALAVPVVAMPAAAGQGTPGQARQRPHVYALTGATVLVRPGETLENATLVLRNGLVEAVGTDVEAPADADVVDASDKTVWAGWIDGYSHLGLPEEQEEQAGRRGRRGGSQQEEPDPGTGHPISMVHPEYRVTDELTADGSAFERHRAAGFTTALVVPRSGIYKGRASVIVLRETGATELVVVPDLAQSVGFESGGFGGGYPGSLMGVIATIRQVALDAQRYAAWRESWERDPTGIRRPESNEAFPALQAALAGDEPVIFDAPNARSVERILRIADEFGLRPIIKGNGEEYETVSLLAEADVPVIVPVDYPDEPDLGEEHERLDVPLERFRAWKMAPANAAALHEAGVRFAFTADGLDSPDQFRDNVRKAVEAGLPEDAALAALTTDAAAILGIEELVGSVEAGRIANVVVADGPPFAEETRIETVYVDGRPFEVERRAGRGNRSSGPADPRGTWRVVLGAGDFEQEMTWFIDGDTGAYTGRVTGLQGANAFDRVELDGNELTVAMTTPMGSMDLTVFIEGDTFSGSMQVQDFTLGIRGRRVSGPGADVIDVIEGNASYAGSKATSAAGTSRASAPRNNATDRNDGGTR